ncbi:hypothetical protein [Aestuariivirga sp.]|uniref:hypothetical protein n=1 Tax=Aestuariivirga sp. TaxID=2650926 RepID=UPI003BA85D9D
MSPLVDKVDIDPGVVAALGFDHDERCLVDNTCGNPPAKSISLLRGDRLIQRLNELIPEEIATVANYIRYRDDYVLAEMVTISPWKVVLIFEAAREEIEIRPPFYDSSIRNLSAVSDLDFEISTDPGEDHALHTWAKLLYYRVRSAPFESFGVKADLRFAIFVVLIAGLFDFGLWIWRRYTKMRMAEPVPPQFDDDLRD